MRGDQLPTAGSLVVVSFHANTWTPNEAPYESARFQLDWSKIADDLPASNLLPFSKDEAGIVRLVAGILAHRKSFEQAKTQLAAGKISEAADSLQGMADFLKVIVTGMQVTPVTGTDAPAALSGQVDAAFKIVQVTGNPGLNPNDAPGITTIMGPLEAAKLAGFDSLLGGVGTISQFVLDVLMIRALVKDVQDSKKYPGGWKDPGIRAKYGKSPQWTAFLTAASSGTSLTLAITNALNAAKAYADLAKTANLALNIPSTLVPILSGGLGAVYTARLGAQAEQSRLQNNALAKLKKKVARAPDKTLKPLTKALLGYAIEATYRKHWTKAVGAGASAGTAASSAALGAVAWATTAAAASSISVPAALTAGAILATANIWNPLGWGLGIAAFVTGGVLLGYRYYRKANKAELAAEWGFSKEEFPDKLIDTYLAEIKDDAKSLDVFVLHTLLAEFGLNFLTIINNPGEAATAISRQVTWT
jgi:hypothetical protein